MHTNSSESETPTTNNIYHSLSQPENQEPINKMPKKLQKALQLYLSKIKNPNPSKSWVLSGCKYPKTPSSRYHSQENQQNSSSRDGAATLSDVDRFLIENFKSLYVKNDDEFGSRRKVDEDGEYDQCYYDQSPKVIYDSPKTNFELPPDLVGSHRFFVTAGSSSSLIEEARSSLTTTATATTTTTTSSEEERPSSSNSIASNNTLNLNDSARNSKGNENGVELPDDCIAVIQYSASPADDFRRSMQEMAESRIEREGKMDWDFMQELLYCYLDLNEQKSHKFILNAFVDLVVSLRQRSDEAPAKSRRSSRSARERRRRLRNVT
ncbi:hypothetical protein JCGZ_06263 [Jatropha curcas]|uniref:Transcription repressor n=1 Tax=Jatropha curcas TaxID=180498 RepID=A0A067KMA2_JATCU|nr:transcription repressor OFP14 [Jatropha curcas]KDP37207.1 hypothetical protein JCGZ_06263 [Jatropha curcas]